MVGSVREVRAVRARGCTRRWLGHGLGERRDRARLRQCGVVDVGQAADRVEHGAALSATDEPAAQFQLVGNDSKQRAALRALGRERHALIEIPPDKPSRRLPARR